MLGHFLRLWPNIEKALGECPVSADDVNLSSMISRLIKDIRNTDTTFSAKYR